MPYAGGDAFYFTGDAGVLPHLYFILSDPAAYPEEILLISVTKCSPEKRVDSACLLKPGDHEFIRMDSFLYYREVWQVTTKILDDLVQRGKLEKRAAATPELLQRMREGAKASYYIREKYVLLLEKQGLINL